MGSVLGAGVDPRTPVLVGAGQLSQRVDRGEPELEPVDLMVEAARRAEAASGAGAVLKAADSVRVVGLLSWRYADAGALLGERVGASPRQTLYTSMGGNYAQTLVNRTAGEIARGELDLALLAGAEAWRTRTKARKDGGKPNWTHQPDGVAPSEVLGADDPPLNGPAEAARGVFMPTQIYPMFEIALRHRLGLGVDEHRDRIAELWARFSDVAATNPHAWIQRRYSPAELREATPDNRMIGFPYTKLLNSNNNVEQGAALVLCSAERAAALGVPRDRWVFVHSGADAHDHWFVSERADLCSSPAMRLAGGAALALAGVEPGELDHVDLYSCFPSAVQIAALELGLPIDRPLTVTGGMSFAGGPWNNYPMHAIATMAGLLQQAPGSVGLCTANGGFTTKHSFGVYASRPPAAGGFRHALPQAEVDALRRREVATEAAGPAVVEAYTVTHDRDGSPASAPVAVLLPDGRRAWATSEDPATMARLMELDCVGAPATVSPEGHVELEP
jgi:acetyl-CoA C-acetyltransferase